MDEPWYRIGRVQRASGLGGEVRVRLFRPRRELARSPGRHGGDARARGLIKLDLRAGASSEVAIEHARWIDPMTVVLRIQGIDDRAGAEALTGAWVSMDPHNPPHALADDADRTLGGCVVEDGSGEIVGTVVAVEDNGAQAVLVIARDGGERLVPFVREIVPAVERDERGDVTVRVRPIPGLLGDDAEGS